MSDAPQVNEVANGGALLGGVSGLGAGWWAYRTGKVAEGAFSLKPLTIKTTYWLYLTTIGGYFAGKYIFGKISPLPQPPKRK